MNSTLKTSGYFKIEGFASKHSPFCSTTPCFVMFLLSLSNFFVARMQKNSWEWECLQCRLLTKPMLDAHFHLDVYHPLSLLQPSSTFTIACYYHHQLSLSLSPSVIISSLTITAQYHHKSATITIVSTYLHHPRSWSLVTVIVHCYCYFITGVLACIMNKSPRDEAFLSFSYSDIILDDAVIRCVCSSPLQEFPSKWWRWSEILSYTPKGDQSGHGPSFFYPSRRPC